MFLGHRRVRVFLYGHPIDMRLSFERLSSLIREEMREDILQGHLYLFLGRNRRRAKVLLFDGTGLVLIHKRLECGRFMRLEDLEGSHEMTTAELSLLLEGTRISLPLSPPVFVQKNVPIE